MRPVTVWVTFADRAGAERDPAALAGARARMTPRALARRRLRGTLKDVDASDLPVHEPYVRALAARGARVRGTSRWLNAASIRIPARAAKELARLPFVSEVELVPVGRVSQDPSRSSRTVPEPTPRCGPARRPGSNLPRATRRSTARRSSR